ncbi:hypothetical protein GPECTOR_178g240 [Gonium pectorale]|uniref:SRCR domain-containing protein n=1 Tax=Gonium pectorale TaxID=33097 RepID=A0A150FX92_GONPE|nr:hypothetical protein GPECTOR_178g240 [Gonium pectorale]|eukprot:KXZ42231.1 hypothetical protein GPECTOR_178g240 [Gonium pectorale]
MRVFLALTLVLLLAQLSCGEYYGVRLAGGSGSVGRLEMRSSANFLGQWLPVCDDDSFRSTQSTRREYPRIMCQLLGYPYGRHTYLDELIYRPGDASLSRPVKINFCSAKASSEGGRHLLGRLGEGSDAGGSSLVEGDRRQLYSPIVGTIDAAPDAPYECQIQSGLCDKTGPLVALECSHTLLPELPRPPVRPVPGPTSAWGSGSVRLMGGVGQYWLGMVGIQGVMSFRVEPNLCNYKNIGDCLYGRVEIEVPAPGGGNGTVWAPLCAPPPDVSAFDLARLMCRQLLGLRPTSSVDYISGASTPFDIPQGPVTTEGHFNPAKYAAWANIMGGTISLVAAVQDLSLNVTSSPCADGKLFAAMCSRFGR